MNATLTAGMLEIAIDNNSSAALLSLNATQAFVDEDGGRAFDLGEDVFDKALISSLTVTDTSEGSFFWGDVFSLTSASIQTGSVNIEGTINLTSLSIDASQNVVFGGSTVVDSLTVNTADSVTNKANSSLTVNGIAQLNADSVTLGNQAGDTIDIDVLQANNLTADITIAQDQALSLGNISVADLDLSATGAITQNAGTTINTTTGLTLDANGGNSNVNLNGTITGGAGPVSIFADDSILMSSAASIGTTTGDVTLTANTDGLVGDFGGVIRMQNGATIVVGDAEIQLTSTGNGGGSITLGHLETTSAANNAVTINSGAAIIDGTTAEPAAVIADSALNISAINGGVNLQSVSSIGGAGDLDIDVNVINAVFNADGGVWLSDSAGGLTINGVSKAVLGGEIQANSPLTIAANITLNADMTFTAGDSANPDDDIRISNNAIVLVDSNLSRTVRFHAGDDIIFQTGRIVTQGLGQHNIHLIADRDNAGVGALDGDRGSVEESAGVVEVTTNNLTVNAGENITLDTAIDRLVASTSAVGAITIRDAGDLELASVVTGAGAVNITVTGAIRGVTDDNSADVHGGLGVTLSAQTGITGAGGVGRLDIGAGNVVNATTAAGPIQLDGLGALTLNDVSSGNGAVDVRSAQDLTATSVRTDATDAVGNNITLASLNRDVIVLSVIAGPNNGDVSITANRDIVDGDSVGSDNTDVSGNDVQLTATNGNIGVQPLPALPPANVFIGYVPTLEVTATGNLTANANAATGIIALDPSVTGTITLNAQTAWLQKTGNLNAVGQVFNVNNLALIADSDLDGVGTLTIDPLVIINGDLRIEGADVTAAAGIELAATRLMFVSGRFGIAPLVNESILIHTAQFDGTVTGNFDIVSRTDNPVELIDLNQDNVAVQTRSTTGSITFDADQTVTVTDDVIAGNDATVNSTGSIRFDVLSNNVRGNTQNLIINDTILTDNGNIDLFVDNDILFRTVPAAVNDQAVVTSIDGNISLTADVNGLGATGVILMNQASQVVAGRAPTAYNPGTLGGPASLITPGGVAKAVGAQITLLATGNITLDSLVSANATANAISVTSTAGGILDGNGGAVNLTANNNGAGARLRALTGIGSADAIDTSLFSVDAVNGDNLPAVAIGNVRILEMNGGGDLRVVQALNDADAGDVAVQVEAGQLLVNGVVSTEQGNISLNSVNRDIQVNSNITSQAGHITLVAGDDVLVNANITTGPNRTIFVRAGNALNNGAGSDGIVMADNTFMRTFGGVIRLDARNSSDIILGLLDTVDADQSTGFVSLLAGRSVLVGANDAGERNIDAGQLRIVANTSGTNVGIIGGSDTGNANANLNSNAINTRVQSVAAESAQGIYLAEENGLTITSVVPAAATQVNFDSSLTIVNDAALSDLRTTPTAAAPGPIKVITTTGSLVVGPGANANGLGIEATGDVLLQTLAADGDIVVQALAGISSLGGNISLRSADDVDVLAAITTTGIGEIVITAANGSGADVFNGIRIAAPITAATGDIVLDSTVDLNIADLVQSTGGNVALRAQTGSVVQLANVSAGIDILAQAGVDYLMTFASVLPPVSLTAGQSVVVIAGRDIELDLVSGLNVALDAGRDISDDNLTALNVRANALIMRASGQIGAADLASPADQNREAIDVSLGRMILDEDGRLAASAAQGIYIQEVSAVSRTVIVTNIAFNVAFAGRFANFNSTTDTLSFSSAQSREDLRGGPVKVVLDNSSLVVQRGTVDNIGVQTTGQNILLSARGVGNVTIEAPAIVTSGAGHTTLQAAGAVTVGGEVNTTTGSVFATATDISVPGTIRTTSGNVRLFAVGGDSSVAGAINSTSGKIALQGVDVNVTGSVTTGVSGEVLVSATDDLVMGPNGSITAGAQVLAFAQDDITLGRVQALTVRLQALQGDILDGNIDTLAATDGLNVRANQLSLIAGGFIGAADVNAFDVNVNAIDIQLGQMIAAENGILAGRAGSGLYLQETSAAGRTVIQNIAVSAINFQVTQVNFRSDTVGLDSGLLFDTQEDLLANGPVKFVLNNQSLEVTAGLAGATGVQSLTSDVLLDARAGDLLVRAGSEVRTDAGHITLAAGGTLTVLGSVVTNSGHLNLTAGNDVEIRNTLNVPANLRIFANGDVLIASPIVGAAGSNIGIQANGDVNQNANITAGSSALLRSGNNYNMQSGTSVIAGSTIIVDAATDLNLSFLQASQVATRAGSNIVDNNGAALNIRANTLGMQATGAIGGSATGNGTPTLNANAIDIQLGGLLGGGVGVLAARANQGLYLQETSLTGSVIVTNVNFGINFDVQRVHFRSTSSPINLTATEVREDLGSGGPGAIKLVMDNGSLTIQRGIADDAGVSSTTGDVLLDARGASSNLTIGTAAIVSSTTGNISLSAGNLLLVNGSIITTGVAASDQGGTIFGTGREVEIRGPVNSNSGNILFRATQGLLVAADIASASGSIAISAGTDVTQQADLRTTSGSILVLATNDVLMSANADTEATNGNVLIIAGRDIELGRVRGLRVGLQAGEDIVDSNAGIVNVVANELNASAGGLIGNEAPLSADTVNPNAIDLTLGGLNGATRGVLAARAGSGMYFQEIGVNALLEVDAVGAVSVTVGVQQVNFNSTRQPVSATGTRNALEDLVADQGPVKVVLNDGSIVVRRGLLNDVGVSTTNGDILLEARSSGNDVTIAAGATVTSDTGAIQLSAEDLLLIQGSVSTTSAASSNTQGTVYGTGRSVEVRGPIQTVAGNIRLQATQNILVTSPVTSASGNIALVAGADVNQQANVSTIGGSILVRATNDVNMASAVSTFAGPAVVIIAGRDINLASVRALDVGLDAGRNIVDANSTGVDLLNVRADRLNARAVGLIGNDNTANAATANINAIDIQLGQLTPGVDGVLAATAGTAMYFEETSANGLLIIDAVNAITVTVGVQQVNFNSTRFGVATTGTRTALEDLRADGRVKVVVDNGSLVVRRGVADDVGVRTVTGDILLDARGAGSDVTIAPAALVTTGSGAIHLRAADQVTIFGSVTSTINDGVQPTLRGAIFVDATVIEARGPITTGSGNILLAASQSILVTADITSTTGAIGLVAGNNVNLGADVTTGGTNGNVLVNAAADVIMLATSDIFAGSTAVIIASNDIQLGRVQANDVGLQAGRDILDNNNGTLNVRANRLNASAGRFIGGDDLANAASVNLYAIDIQLGQLTPGTVGVLAASAGNGMYFQETTAGGLLTIDSVDALTVNVGVQRVNFNSTRNAEVRTGTRAILEDLTATTGPVKLVMDNGSLIVFAGTADPEGVEAVTGDVLLEVRGAGNDITVETRDNVNASVVGGRFVSLVAADQITTRGPVRGQQSVTMNAINIDIEDDVTSNGFIVLTASQDILINGDLSASVIHATANRDITQNRNVTGDLVSYDAGRDIIMGAAATIDATNAIGLKAVRDVSLGRLNAGTVDIEADRNIIDANDTPADGKVVNIQARFIKLIAGDAIGAADGLSGATENRNAIDFTGVAGIDETLAARAVNGIYLEEVSSGGNTIIDRVTAFGIGFIYQTVNFNSSTTDNIVGFVRESLEDLTSGPGPIKLVLDDSSLIVRAGTDNSQAVRTTTGDILLDARGTAGSITVAPISVISSTSGNIALLATDDISVSFASPISTAGDVYLRARNQDSTDAFNGIELRSSVTSTSNTLVMQSFGDIRFSADLTSSLEDVGLFATGRVDHFANIVAGNDIVVDAGGDITMREPIGLTAFSSTATRNVLFDSNANIVLGTIRAVGVALDATGNITDGNASVENIVAGTLRMTAGGSIGASDISNVAEDENVNAIDLVVNTVAASAGGSIYLEELAIGGDLTIDHVDAITVTIQAVQPDFRSTRSDVVALPPLGIGKTLGPLDDVEAANNIKIKVDAGSLIVNPGDDNDGIGVRSSGSGNVLLLASSDVRTTAEAGIRSGTGNVSLLAGDDVSVLAPVSTAGSGEIYINASNSTNDSANDGVLIGGLISTAQGDILILSERDIRVNSNVQSISGSIGFQASRDLVQNADIFTTITVGSPTGILMVAGRDIAMGANADVSTQGSPSSPAGSAGNILMSADGAIRLGSLRAVNVALTAGTNILDNNGALTNVFANGLSMRADGTIGQKDAVPNANEDINAGSIDTQVTTLAARAGTGVFVEELASGGALTIGQVSDVAVTISVPKVNFRSDTSPITRTNTLATLSDVETLNNGEIKVVVDNGTLTVLPGATPNSGVTAHGTGDILLRAIGAASDVLVQASANVTSGTGNIRILADDDVRLFAPVSTGGAGTIFIQARNQTDEFGATGGVDGVEIAALVQTGSGQIVAQARSADSDVVVQSTGTVRSGSGNIILQADDDVRVFGPVITASNGAILIEALNQTDEFGATGGVDGVEVANLVQTENGEIRLRALGADSDVVVQELGSIRSNAGDVVLFANDDVRLYGPLVTSGAGKVNLTAENQTDEFIAIAGIDGIELADLVQSATGAITLFSRGEIEESATTARILSDQAELTLTATTYAHLHDVTVGTLTATVGMFGDLKAWQEINANAALKSTEFLEYLKAFLRDQGESDVIDQNFINRFDFKGKFNDFRTETGRNGFYALYVVNNSDLTVKAVTAGNMIVGPANRPNVYIETKAATSDLTLNGTITTQSNRVPTDPNTTNDSQLEGGVVLVAGGNLSLTTGSIVTERIAGLKQTVNSINDTVVDPIKRELSGSLNGKVFDAQGGIAPEFTTKVVQTTQKGETGPIFQGDKEPDTFVLQRVVMQFGAANEKGFVMYVGYADGVVQEFDAQGDTGRLQNTNQSPDGINAQPTSAAPPKVTVFSRSTPFENAFLNNNQSLPTLAIMRRADDFFFFENASSADTIRDLTVEVQNVEGVISTGDRGATEMPVDPEPPLVGTPILTVPVLPPPQVPQQINTLPEIPVFIPKPIEVALYRVSFTDKDENGQPEQGELPTNDTVKQAEIVKEEEFDKKAKESKGTVRARIKQLEIETGGTASAQDIDKFKADFLNDPEQSSGAYSIIQKDSNDKETVLEVFSLRDWPEEIKKDQPVIQPEPEAPAQPAVDPEAAKPKAEEVPAKPDPNSNTSWQRDSQPGNVDANAMGLEPNRPAPGKWSARLAASGVMAGALWMIRETGDKPKESLLEMMVENQQTSEDNALTKFDRRSRRSRRRPG